MRKVLFAIAVLVTVQGLALGQTSSERRGWGYVFAGVGGRSNASDVLINVGGGGEGYFGNGVGLGGEIGYLTTKDSSSEGFGLASVNTSYHFLRSQKVVPFITGGASLAFRQSALGGGNFGGGAHYWMSDRLGLRFEVRDHIFSSDSPHTVIFRVGLTFK